jgi:hypothetical protein
MTKPFVTTLKGSKSDLTIMELLVPAASDLAERVEAERAANVEKVKVRDEILQAYG